MRAATTSAATLTYTGGDGGGGGRVLSRRHQILWLTCILFTLVQFILFGYGRTTTSTTTSATPSSSFSSSPGGAANNVTLHSSVQSLSSSSSSSSSSSTLLQIVPPKEEEEEEPYLYYDLHVDRPYKMIYSPYIHCPLGSIQGKGGNKKKNHHHPPNIVMERLPLASPFPSILNITTYIQTNMNILILGDSIGIQFYQLLAEAMNVKVENMNHLRYAWGLHESVSIAAPVQGGGVLGALRITGMLLRQGLGRPLPNNPGGGWSMEDVNSLVQYTYHRNDSNKNNQQQEQYYNHYPPTNRTTTTTTTVVQQFDSMIFRIPYGWIFLNDITRDTLIETLELSHVLFGVRTIIIMTLPINNNIFRIEQLEKLQQTNIMIRDVVNHWPEYSSKKVNKMKLNNSEHGEDATTTSTTGRNGGGGLEHVLLMDFGRWAMQLVEVNAKEVLGWTNTPTTITTATPINYTIQYNFTLNRLSQNCHNGHAPSVAMVCVNMTQAEAVKGKTCDCFQRNQISVDGMHWCMESVGGRSVAAISCLLQCPLQFDGRGGEKKKFTINGTLVIDPELRGCEQHCNDRFMSLTPVEELLRTSSSSSSVQE